MLSTSARTHTDNETRECVQLHSTVFIAHAFVTAPTDRRFSICQMLAACRLWQLVKVRTADMDAIRVFLCAYAWVCDSGADALALHCAHDRLLFREKSISVGCSELGTIAIITTYFILNCNWMTPITHEIDKIVEFAEVQVRRIVDGKRTQSAHDWYQAKKTDYTHRRAKFIANVD